MNILGHEYKAGRKIYHVLHFNKRFTAEERNGFIFITGVSLTRNEVQNLRESIYLYEKNMAYQDMVRNNMHDQISDELLDEMIRTTKYCFDKKA